jgi:hypothetical protein
VRNDKIASHSSERLHTVELSIRYSILDYTILILVDWASGNDEIQRRHVNSLIEKMADTRANKGVLLSAEGGDSKIKMWAEKHSIDLYPFAEISHIDWSAGLTIPLLYDLRQPDLKIQFSGDVDEGFQFPENGLGVRLPLEEGGEITLFSLFQMMWNGGSIPSEPGRYDYPIPVYSKIFIENEGKTCAIEQIIFNVEVFSMKYFGYADLNTCRKIAGILENHNGKKNLGEMLVDVNTIKSEWEYIPDDKNISENIDFPTMVIEVREQVV